MEDLLWRWRYGLVPLWLVSNCLHLVNFELVLIHIGTHIVNAMHNFILFVISYWLAFSMISAHSLVS